MAAQKRLYRSKSDRILGGVLGGFSDYVNADPSLIRIIYIILTLASFGFGVLLYLAAWLIVPEK
ncbi:MAG: PspC domain-containing protein [archaeon]